MRKGDILLIKSLWDFPIGWIIRHGTKGNFNHCAWAIDNKTLIELKAKGKRITPLKKYLNKWLYKVKLVRIKNIGNCKLSASVERAIKAQFKFPYSSAIINFLLIKLKITKELPRLSCSGFIAYYLAQEAVFYFNNESPYFITPKDIESSKNIKDVTDELY